MVSTLVFAFKIIRHIIFFCSKKVSFPQSSNFSTVKEVFYSQETFPQSSNFSTIKELFHNQGTFLQSRNLSTIKKFSTIKELFCNQRTFPQSWNFSTTKELFQNQGTSTVMELFHSRRNLLQKDFILSTKFSTNNEVFYI